MEKKTYKIEVECTNCGQYKEIIEIEKGTTVLQELEYHKCPMCGCKKLRRTGESISWCTTNSVDNTIAKGSYPKTDKVSIYDNSSYLN